MNVRVIVILFSVFYFCCCTTQPEKTNAPKDEKEEKPIVVGAERLDLYLDKLKNKNIALVVNQTSRVKQTHLVDTLLSLGVKIACVFAPEHGFRGNADAGEHIENHTDKKTGIKIVSLFGKNKKPTKEQLSGIDVVIFDIQDVGVRFYTYISTMHYAMEACAENNKHFIVLDRPNPNGDYIDGAVLKPQFKSFVGMHPIPVVHALTVAELAQMINKEGWLKDSVVCPLEVVPCANYKHKKKYSLPVKPSPNLPNDIAIRLYPSLCFFEATEISIGRGTYFPFQVIGFPDSSFGNFAFEPKSIVGMSKFPKHENKTCYGIDLQNESTDVKFTLSYLLDFYKKWKSEKPFFARSRWMNLLSGTDALQAQIKQGLNEKQIRKSWEKDINSYKLLRKKYLLYEDFE